jgi:hypothetical protein
VNELGLDQYDVGEVIGRGATGTVHLAIQRSVGRTVAVKRVRCERSGAIARLRHEAALLAALDHPHIIRLIDIVDDGDGVALVMPVASGGSLASLIASRGELAEDEVAAIGARLADALASAHRRGLLHLDVKPDNVLLTADGEPLLADFGVARLGASADTAPVGTTGFVAPEVLAGGACDRSDVYSLAQVCRAALGPDESPTLGALLAAATVADPAQRPTASDLALRLRGLAGPLPCPGGQGLRADTSRTRTFGPRPPRAPSPVSSAPRTRRRDLAVAFLVFVVALVAWRSSRHSTPTAARPVAPACTSIAPTSVPVGAVAVEGDLDGSGCTTPVLWSPSLAEALVPGPNGAVRYLLGQPGDALLIGDWDCDGADTPALYRPATGEVFLFDAWADGDLPLPSAPPRASGSPDSTPRVTRAARCDEVIVDEGTRA